MKAKECCCDYWKNNCPLWMAVTFKCAQHGTITFDRRTVEHYSTPTPYYGRY